MLHSATGDWHLAGDKGGLLDLSSVAVLIF